MKTLLLIAVSIIFILASQPSIGVAGSQIGLNPYFLSELDKAFFETCMDHEPYNEMYDDDTNITYNESVCSGVAANIVANYFKYFEVIKKAR